MMSSNVKLLSAREVAESLVEGMIDRRYAILPGEAGLVWKMNRYFPNLVRWIIDIQYRRARKKLGKET